MERALGIHAAAPKDQVCPELLLQLRQIHALSTDLHRVEDIHAGIEEIGDEGTNGPARMKEQLDRGHLLDGTEQAFMARLDHLAISGGGHEQVALSGQIIRFHDHIDQITDLCQGPLPKGDFVVHQFVEHGANPGLVQGEIDIKCLVAAQPRIDFGDARTGTGQDGRLAFSDSSLCLRPQPYKTPLVDRVRKGIRLQLGQRVGVL